MKKNKVVFTIITILTLIITGHSSVVYALDYVACGSATGIPKPVPQMTTIAYTLLMVGTPIVLVVSAIITLVKATMSGNEDNVVKSKSKLFKKFIIAALVFLTSGLVKFTITHITSTDSDKSTVGDCLSCFLYFENCQASKSGNDVEEETYTEPHSNIEQAPSTFTSPKDRLKFFNSLSVLHSGQAYKRDNTIELFTEAGQNKFYAAECDLRMSGDLLYCAHDRSASDATTFEQYLEICEKYKMMAVLDIKWCRDYTKMQTTLGEYISTHKMQDRIIVQTADINVMERINTKATGVKYWYLMTGSSGYSTFLSEIDEFKKVGGVGVNMACTFVTEDVIKNVEKNGLTTCVYSVDGKSSREKYSNYGADFIMTNLTS